MGDVFISFPFISYILFNKSQNYIEIEIDVLKRNHIDTYKYNMYPLKKNIIF